MLATLAENYTKAINGGAVPNIESAWSYICQNECQKGFDMALEKFEEILATKGFQRIPHEEAELKDIYSEAKKEALQLFKKTSIGGGNEEFLENLKERMKFRFQDLRDENEREAGGYCSQYLIENYQVIDNKLKNKEYPSFVEYEMELKAL